MKKYTEEDFRNFLKILGVTENELYRALTGGRLCWKGFRDESYSYQRNRSNAKCTRTGSCVYCLLERIGKKFNIEYHRWRWERKYTSSVDYIIGGWDKKLKNWDKKNKRNKNGKIKTI